MYKAMLLIGPTGAGKTPLGKYLERHGLNGRRCRHFDFGANLRSIISATETFTPLEVSIGMNTSNGAGSPQSPSPFPLPRGERIKVRGIDFSTEEIRFVKSVLKTGALLEDKDFPLARKILESFIQRHNITGKDIIVLNGLPRHIGQAQMMGEFIQVELIVHLTATPEVLYERIRTNAGGDRSGRTDDSLDDIRTKIETFNTRTEPLVEYYRQQGARVETITTDLDTGAADVRQKINNQCQ
jgi:adenylate kinase family enzyme